MDPYNYRPKTKKLYLFAVEMFKQNIVPSHSMDKIIEYLNLEHEEYVIKKREQNKLAQRKYYQQHKEKVKKQNLEAHHRKKDSKLDEIEVVS